MLGHAYARALHPVAWWVWALGLATAASRTTNLVLLALLVAGAAFVVSGRAGDTPWARSFRSMLVLGAVVIVVRVVFQAVAGAYVAGTVILTVPELSAPEWLGGVGFGGPFTVEALVAAVREGARLAAMLACIGAAMSLASPHRLLAALPAALYEAGVAVVVAVSFAPEAVASVGRVREAQRLRGGVGDSRRRRSRRSGAVASLRRIAVAVFEGGLERSVNLAASMDSRGYGRRALVPRGARTLTSVLLLVGLGGVALGAYGLLGDVAPASVPTTTSLVVLVVGLALATASMALAGRRSVRTRYRPDPWRVPEWAVLGCGCLVAAAYVAAAIAGEPGLTPQVTPLALPVVPPLLAAATLLALAPAWLAPPPPSTTVRRPGPAGAGRLAAASRPSVEATR